MNPTQRPVVEKVGGARQKKRCKLNTKATIRVAGLNISGHGNVNPYHPDNKWNHIPQMMREKRIGILVVGEAHLNEERHRKISDIHERSLKIFYSEGPEGENAKGVAIVLNKAITNTEDVTAIEVVPGRALLLTTNWHGEEKMSILGIYADNDPRDNAELWKLIEQFFETNRRVRRPDIVLGDFNVVEDAIDRLPPRHDPDKAVLALDSMKLSLQLVDGWRDTYPDKLDFTFSYPRGKSRLDRIYARDNIIQNSWDWKIEESGIKTDHMLVSAQIASNQTVETKRGRWTIPKHLHSDKKLTEEIKALGKSKLCDMEAVTGDLRTTDTNPQTIFYRFKLELIRAARTREKVVIPRVQKAIQILETERENILNDPDIENETKIQETGIIEAEVTRLSKKKHTSARMAVKIRHIIEGETLSKSWTQLGKEKKTRDLFRQLKTGQVNKAGLPIYERDSNRMAGIMRRHHDELQRDDINEATIEERLEEISDVTDIIDNGLTDDERAEIDEAITEEDITLVLRRLGNNKAPGIDGITYEYLRKLMIDYENDTKKEERSGNAFNIIRMLMLVYNDILEHGMTHGTEFAKGWMCPIYKKNDKTEPANYRPITLLNSDYKIYTKILSIRLARTVPRIIHKNQAGFIPGRNIYDQVKLVRTIINYAEATETNGLIVALDQEKAYDKISHDYLWEVLARFKLPAKFIDSLKSLYSDAETQVMINGFLSRPFKVTRGVRQGDPLSCLLFDLAIEPLAIMLRKSGLRGIPIPDPERVENLVATLFADDTTTYLSEYDDFEDLQTVLQTWCKASRAKFNITKTEVIPIGTEEYRKQVIETRKTHNTSSEIPQNVHVVEDGNSVRVLGGWVGNNVDDVAPWTKILTDIDRRLAIWEMSKPTIEGRRLVILMVIGGKTQYLNMVQGMPECIMTKLNRRISRFMWEGKHPTVNSEKLKQSSADGGKDILDLVARNEAITIMWLKSYLNFGENRATWAFFADELIARHATKEISLEEF